MFNQPIESWELSRVTNISQILKNVIVFQEFIVYLENYRNESRKERLKEFCDTLKKRNNRIYSYLYSINYI
jgi:hypothetical protein